ncbi:MAG TPA: fumarylacetoacetate hydrolase family protein [Thermoanaerobaculia bacterium]|nr:fumarylacetoacetate hydrolase family protein [Thermoanaerobaculia bacterium]
MIRLYRIAPEGLYAATDPSTDDVRVLYSDPFESWPGGWEYGRRVDLDASSFLAPVAPSKIIGIGRNYRDHARELGNPMPTEPMFFLKALSALSGPRAPIVLPPESEQVEFEGEIALVLRHRLRRASAEEARTAILGVMPACDVTARDIQKKDGRFARAKGFDTFCPVGPAIGVDPDLDDLSVITRVNGVERQRGHGRDMAFSFLDILVYLSRMMTLERGDVVLTGTPAGVGSLADGDVVEVEIPGLGVLVNPVEAWRAAGEATSDHP